jgi:hypothetical protein
VRKRRTVAKEKIDQLQNTQCIHTVSKKTHAPTSHWGTQRLNADAILTRWQMRPSCAQAPLVFGPRPISIMRAPFERRLHRTLAHSWRCEAELVERLPAVASSFEHCSGKVGFGWKRE